MLPSNASNIPYSLLWDMHCGYSSLQPFCWDSAWAISGYCFSIAFAFGLSQIITRHLLTKKTSKNFTMNSSSSKKRKSVKRGRTRLIPELLTLSFAFRAVWFFMKGLPGEPWACTSNTTSKLFVNETDYGNPLYALREMFNRFATLMSFSAFTVLVVFWAGTSTIITKRTVVAAETSQLDAYTALGSKVSEPKYTCCQGFYVSLNVWLYLALIAITLMNFIPNHLNDKCYGFPTIENATTLQECLCIVPNTTAGSTNSKDTACLTYRIYQTGLIPQLKTNHTYKWHDSHNPTIWSIVKEVTILFTNALYILLVLGIIFFGAGVMRALKGVHTSNEHSDQAINNAQNQEVQGKAGISKTWTYVKRRCGIQAMRWKIMSVIIVCTCCFSARFVIFAWPYVVTGPDKYFSGLACDVIRPYFQYVVVELLPAIVVLVVMVPSRNLSSKSKFSSGNDSVIPNNVEALVIRSTIRASTYGLQLLPANDPQRRI